MKKKEYVKMVCGLLAFGLLIEVTPVYAKAPDDEERSLPIHVKGGQARFQSKKGEPTEIMFSGGVQVRQGSATVKADDLVATLDSGSRQVKTAVATGNVRLRDGDRIGIAERAEFMGASSSIVLTGSPRLWEKGNLMEGKRIVFYLLDGRVDCRQCSVVLDPDEVKTQMN